MVQFVTDFIYATNCDAMLCINMYIRAQVHKKYKAQIKSRLKSYVQWQEGNVNK